MGVYYDTQAVISYLIREKGIKMKDIWLYGFCQGSFHAIFAATHFFNIGGVIIDRGLPDYRMMSERSMMFPTGLYDRIFPSGIKDEIVSSSAFIEPEMPFVTRGMSNVNFLDEAAVYEERNEVLMAPFFFMYGESDYIVPFNQVKALIFRYLGKNAAEFRDGRFYRNSKLIKGIYRLKKGHLEFFMKDEDIVAKELNEFIKETVDSLEILKIS